MNKAEIEAYVRGLCKDKSYDEAKTERAVAKALAQADDEDAVLLHGVLELPIKGTSDYNRKVDELRSKATTLDNWKTQADVAFAANEKARVDAEARLVKMEAKFGKLEDITTDDDGKTRGKSGKEIKSDDLKALLDARDEYHLRLTADLGDIRADHAKMFKGEVISDRQILAEIGRVANDKSIPEDQRSITAKQAYDRLYGDQVKKHNEEQIKASEQRLRDEGAKAERERASRQGMRTGAAVGESAIVDALNRKKDDPRDKLTDEDRIAALAADMEGEFAKNDARYSDAAT